MRDRGGILLCSAAEQKIEPIARPCCFENISIEDKLSATRACPKKNTLNCLKVLYIVCEILFDKFYFLAFFGIDAVKKSLFVHPFIAENFAHVARAVVWKNTYYYAVLGKLAFVGILLDGLHDGSRGVAYK